jgi:hypothetical protein
LEESSTPKLHRTYILEGSSLQKYLIFGVLVYDSFGLPKNHGHQGIIGTQEKCNNQNILAYQNDFTLVLNIYKHVAKSQTND